MEETHSGQAGREMEVWRGDKVGLELVLGNFRPYGLFTSARVSLCLLKKAESWMAMTLSYCTGVLFWAHHRQALI